MTLIEAGAVGLCATILGTVASVGAYVGLSLAAPILTGVAPPFHFDPVAPFAYGAAATI